jgi:hypothetical protein
MSLVKTYDPAPADPTVPDVLYFLGMDRSTYPGDTVMQNWWVNSPFFFTGFYLAPAPHHSNTSWMSKRAILVSQGWGFTILYLGRQAGDGSLLNTAQGRTDAQNASALANQAGFAVNNAIFLDIETGGTLSSSFINYIKGWADEIWVRTSFNVGIYCSYSSTANQIKTALGTIPATYWCFRVGCPPSPGCTTPNPAPSPTGCGVSFAVVWQFAQSPQPGGTESCAGYASSKCTKTYSGTTLTLDISTSTTRNPSG